jgi:hypothetical protein
MVKTVSISIDTIATVALLVAVSCGFMLYQKHQFDDLMQEYVDLKWQSGNTEANLVIARNHLEQCRAVASPQEQH